MDDNPYRAPQAPPAIDEQPRAMYLRVTLLQGAVTVLSVAALVYFLRQTGWTRFLGILFVVVVFSVVAFVSTRPFARRAG